MVYLHVPFCRSFCSYCNFYSEIARRDRDAQLFEAYTEAVCAEIARRRDEIEASRDLDTLYIGGGTPSVLPPMYLARILQALAGADRRSGADPERPSPFAEFTFEVNPEDIVRQGPGYVRELRSLGVDRISMGVQSLDDGILRWMNRRHDADRAREAFRILSGAGIPKLSIDLIFGLSQLSAEGLAQTLGEVVAWRPGHISAYQLSIEDGSALDRLVREGNYVEATQEQCAEQYRLLCETLHRAGYIHYEISNWALPGCEAVHNSAYWTRHPYVGLGPGAHSFDGRTRSWNPENLAAYLREMPEPQHETLSAAEIREEELMLGLRTARGVPEKLIPPDHTAKMIADGSLERISGRLRIPEDRWFVSDGIIAGLF